MPFKKGDPPPESCKRPPRGTVLGARQRELLRYYYGPSKLNKTDALRRAGYKNPHNQLNKFNHPSVKAEMARREKAVREKYEVTYERVLDEIAKVAYSSLMDYATIDDAGNFVIDERTLGAASLEEMAALAEVKVETYMEGRGPGAREVKRILIKPHNKLDALDKLMRHAGMSKEKSPLEGAVGLVDRIIAARRRVAPVAEENEDADDE